MAEINVTPLVDVMLVLLIIFMIAAPLIQKGVEVNVPKTAKVQSAAELNTRLLLTVRKVGAEDAVFLGQTRVTVEKLAAAVREHPRVKRYKIVFLDAQPQVSYGFVVKVMAAARASGVELGLVTRD